MRKCENLDDVEYFLRGVYVHQDNISLGYGSAVGGREETFYKKTY